MGVETELKLRLPAPAVPRLRSHPLLAGAKPGGKRRIVSHYHDTPGLDLRRRGVSLRLRRAGRARLVTVKEAAPSPGGLARRTEWEGPTPAGRFDWSVVGDPKLRAWLEKKAPRLRRVFSTDVLRETWLLAPDAATRIELALDRGAIRSGRRREALCEVELELKNGEAGALLAAASALAADLPVHPDPASKAQRGYALFLGAPPRPVKRGAWAPPDPGLTPREAFRRVALRCLEHFQANGAGAALGEDPEFIHQARVAVRRLRCAIKSFAPVLPRGFAARWDGPWREVGRLLGAARDWDVLMDRTLPRWKEAGSRLRAHGETRRRACRRKVRAALASPAHARLLLEFTADLLALKDGGGQPAALPEFARGCLAEHLGRVKRLVRRHAQADAAGRHRLRIACKNVRHAADFFAPAATGKKARRFRAALAKAQRVLGELNDLATAKALAPKALDGPLSDWLDGRSRPLLKKLPAVLRALLKRPPPKVMGEVRPDVPAESRLVLWRHAEAEDGPDDMRRGLTARGRRQAGAAATRLGKHLPKRGLRILVSPARRARQTADALGRPHEVSDALGPGATADDLLAAAGWPETEGTVLLVGHQPALGRVVSRLRDGVEADRPFKKAGTVRIRRKG